MAKNYVSREMFIEKTKNLEEKITRKDDEIKNLKYNQQKVVWIIITLFITALCGVVFVKF